MVTVALYVKLDAKPGKEAELESFLKGGLAIRRTIRKLVNAQVHMRRS